MFGTDTIHSFVRLDMAGRNISAAGASLLVLRLILNFKAALMPRLIATALIIPAVWYGVYQLQEKVVDYVSEVTPLEVKKSQSYSYIYRKGISNGALSFEHIPVTEETSHAEQHVFNSSTVFWGILYPDFQASVDSKTKNEILKDTRAVYKNDFVLNNMYYYRTYMDAFDNVNKMFNRYKNAGDTIGEQTRKADREIEKAWTKKLEVEKSIINRYTSLKHNLSKHEQQRLRSGFYRKSFPHEIMSNYAMLARCSSQSCFDAVHKVQNKWNKIRDIKFSFANDCKFSTTGNQNVIHFNSINNMETYRVKSKYFNFSNYSSVVCHLDIAQAQRYELNTYHNELKSKYGITDFSPRNSKEFRNSQSSSDAIRNLVFEHSNVLLPKGWNRNDKEAFFKAFRENHIGSQIDLIHKKIKENFGFQMRLGMSKDRFYSDKRIKNLIEENAGIFDYEGLLIKNRLYRDEKFIEYYKDKVNIKMADFFIRESEINEEFIDNIFKATVIPIVAICFSLFFGIMNFSIIIKDIACYALKIKSKKVEYYITSFFIWGFFGAPLFVDNYYTSHDYYKESMVPSMVSHNPYMAHGYTWFLNAETMVYSTTKFGYVPLKTLFSRTNSFKKDFLDGK